RDWSSDVCSSDLNKGGLIVNILGLRGFLPTSQVSRTYSSNLQELVGQRIGVKILEVNRKRNRLIVSQKAAFDEDRARQRGELFEKLKVGDEIEGKVSGLTTYGAFVNLGAADGLIHISELSWDRVANVAWEHVERTGDVDQVGEQLRVRVWQADRSRRRISLSLKQAEEPAEGGRPEAGDVSDYPGEIERVPESERAPVYAEVSAAPQE